MFYIIYKITNQVNGKFYIGSHKTKDLNDSYMGSGKYLKHAQAKYGLENFTKEIMMVFDTPEAMYAKEAELVNKDLISEENTYNIKLGGVGGWDHINSNQTEDYIRVRKANGKLTGPTNSKYGLAAAREKYKELIKVRGGRWFDSPGFIGKKHSADTKKRIGQVTAKCQAGEGNSQYGTMWITDGTSSVKIKKTDAVPCGWYKGRKIKN